MKLLVSEIKTGKYEYLTHVCTEANTSMGNYSNLQAARAIIRGL